MIKRLMALNPFAGKKQAKESELEQKVEFEVSENIKIAYEVFQSMKSGAGLRVRRNYHDTLLEQALTPTEIDIFTQILIGNLEQKEFWDSAGLFLSCLLEGSYKEGYNDFNIDVNVDYLTNILQEVEGKEENPLRIRIEGDIAFGCAYMAKYCVVDITGDAGDHVAHYTEDCVFNIGGNTGAKAAEFAKRCIFNVQGNAGKECGCFMWDSEFYIQGDIDQNCAQHMQDSVFQFNGRKLMSDNFGQASRDCIFQTTNPIAYEELVHKAYDVPWLGTRRNKAVLIKSKIK